MKKQVLYTLAESSPGCYEEGARMFAFDSPTEAMRHLNNAYQYSGLEIVGWVQGDPEDCWINTNTPPELNRDGYAEFYGILCHVRPPGHHPGMGYWCDPVLPVMVPILESVGGVDQ